MSEPIMRWFCACAAYPDDPGSVVCWKCEQPLVEIDAESLEGALVQNLLLLGNRYHATLERIGRVHGPWRAVVADALGCTVESLDPRGKRAES